MKFSVEMIPEKGMNYVVLQYKGSYVKEARLIHRKDIPQIIRVNIVDKYYGFKKGLDTDQTSWNPFK